VTDALTLSAKPLQQSAIFRAVGLFELHANALGQRRAVPARRDGDLERATPHDSRGDEVTGLWRVDNVHPDVVCPCGLAHSRIDLSLIGGPDDQRATQDIVGAKGARLIGNGALRCQGSQGFAECGADHNDPRLGVQQPLDFACGNFPAADYQATFSLQIDKHRIIAGHVPLTLTLSRREREYRLGASPGVSVPRDRTTTIGYAGASPSVNAL
jgi:hypothetical protein